MSRNGASSISSSHGISAAPVVRIRSTSSASNAKKIAFVSFGRVCSRSAPPQGRGVRAGDQDPAHRALRPRHSPGRVAEHRDVRDHDAGLGQQLSLSENSGGAASAETSDRRRKSSGTIAVTNCDSPRGTPRGIRSPRRPAPASGRRPRGRVGCPSVAGSGANRVAAPSRGVDRAEAVARDRTRVPHRLEQRGVVGVAVQTTSFVAGGAAATALTPPARTPPDAPVVALEFP